MASYKDIKAGCPSRKRYADGGRVSTSRGGGKTVINVITAPPAAGGMPAPAMPPAAPMGNSPSPAGPPIPPQAAQMALGNIQGKPPGFARGGRIKAGAATGVGRLEKAKRK